MPLTTRKLSLDNAVGFGVAIVVITLPRIRGNIGLAPLLQKDRITAIAQAWQPAQGVLAGSDKRGCSVPAERQQSRRFGGARYRLIHALHVADADLALILFDPTHARDPLSSVHYWLGQLPAECPKILVPARVDRGSPTLTRDELDQFCRDRQISGGFVQTSAAKDIGLDELLARMKAQIPWDRKTAVTTTATFKRIKDFVLALKENRAGRQVIVTPAELRGMLESEPSALPAGLGVAGVERSEPPAGKSAEKTGGELRSTPGTPKTTAHPTAFSDAEMDLINERLLGTEQEKQSVIGLLLDGKPGESLPPLLRGRTYGDFRHEDDYFPVAFDLMLSLYGIGFTDPGIAEWRQRLRGER